MLIIRDTRILQGRALALALLRQMPKVELAEAVGRSVRRLRDPLTERARPRRQTGVALTQVAISFAQAHLRAAGLQPPVDDLAACAAAR